MNIKELETPCFIIDTDEFKANLNDFKRALRKYYPNGILGYSVKTNSLAYILKIVKENNVFAEIVSHDEYDLAEYIGFKNKIIYNGPLKTKETFLNALKSGAYVNIENFQEIEC